MEETRLPCKYCGEAILATAQKCRFCGEFLSEAAASASLAAAARPGKQPTVHSSLKCESCGGNLVFVGVSNETSENPIYSIFRITGCLTLLVGLLVMIGLAWLPGGFVPGLIVCVLGAFLMLAKNQRHLSRFVCDKCQRTLNIEP